MTTWHDSRMALPHSVRRRKNSRRLCYCGTCVLECNHPGAITLCHPLNQSVSVVWKRTTTGEYFRLGMQNPPPPNTKPPAR